MAQYTPVNTRGECGDEDLGPNPAVCVSTLWLRKDLIKIQYIIDDIEICYKATFVHLKATSVVFNNLKCPIFDLVQVHAKPVSQTRTSCIIFSWQCLLVR